MKIQIKMLKRLIAVLCAATMVASGAVASVGAVGNEADKKSDDTASVSSNYTNTTNDTVETSVQRKKARKKITNEELACKEMQRIKCIKCKNMHKEPKNQLSRKNDIGKEPNKKKTQGNNTKSAQKRKERKEFQKIQKEAQKAKVQKLKEEREKRKKSIEHEKKLWLDNNKKKAQEVRKKMAIVPEQKLNKDKKKLQLSKGLANLEANKKAKPISSPKTDKVIGKTKYGLNLGKKLEGIKTGSLNKNKNKKALSKQIYTRKKVSNKKELQWPKELANLVSNQLYGKESKLNGISRLTKKTKKEEKKLISGKNKIQKSVISIDPELINDAPLTNDEQISKEKRLSDNISKLEYGNVIDLSKLDIDKLLTEEFPKPAIKPDGLNDCRDGDHKKVENSGNDEKLKSFAAKMSNNNYPNQLEESKPQDFKKIVNGLKSKNLLKNYQKKQIGQIGSLELSESFLGFLNEIDENSNN